MSADVKHMKAPCATCPFARTTAPGTLGGSPVETYIGQVHGPFVLPCHCAVNYDDPQWREKAIDTPQCAGAAIFRANVGAAAKMPAAIHKLPGGHPNVFSNEAEFVAHHKGVPYEDADRALKFIGTDFLLNRELERAGVITYPVKK